MADQTVSNSDDEAANPAEPFEPAGGESDNSAQAEEKPTASQNPFGVEYAVLLAFGAAALYTLGWIYWSTYFKYFGIDMQFVDFSYHHVISTTMDAFFITGG